MKITIDNRIHVTGATPDQQAAMIALCEHDNPARAGLPALEKELEKRKFDRRLFGQVMRLREESPTLRTWWRESDGSLSLPRGVWSTEAWVPFGIQGSFEDCRSDGSEDLKPFPLAKAAKEPRDYQARGLDAMMREEQGLLRFAAGSGKTFMLLEHAARVRLPTIAIVPTRALLEQWIGVAISDFGIRPGEIGAIGGSSETVRSLTIATVDALAANDCRRAKQFARTFGCLLFDEVYSAPASTRFDVVDCFAARYRFGAGDDERRKDDLEPLTYDLFGEVLAQASRKDLEKAGHILPVRVRMVETGVEAPKWWSILKPLTRSQRYGELVRYLEDEPARAALVAALAARSAGEGQVLVFGHHVDHVDRMLADFCATAPAMASKTGRFLGGEARLKERRETTVGLLEGSVRAAFATYAALGKGINLPCVDRAILTTPIHGNRDSVNQVLARINRTSAGKGQPEAVVPYDDRIFGLAPVRAFLRGGREVLVETRTGETIPGRDYVNDREERERGATGDFFKDLSR